MMSCSMNVNSPGLPVHVQMSNSPELLQLVVKGFAQSFVALLHYSLFRLHSITTRRQKVSEKISMKSLHLNIEILCTIERREGQSITSRYASKTPRYINAFNRGFFCK